MTLRVVELTAGSVCMSGTSGALIVYRSTGEDAKYRKKIIIYSKRIYKCTLQKLHLAIIVLSMYMCTMILIYGVIQVHVLKM